MKLPTLKDLKRELDKDPEHRKEYRRQRPYHDVLVQVVRRRKELGMTQAELAKLSSTHQSQISRIENAEHDIQLSTLIKIAEALGLKVNIRLELISERDRVDWDLLFTMQASTDPDTIEYSAVTEDQTEANELYGACNISVPA